jgi:hypothetical protein
MRSSLHEPSFSTLVIECAKKKANKKRYMFVPFVPCAKDRSFLSRVLYCAIQQHTRKRDVFICALNIHGLSKFFWCSRFVTGGLVVNLGC